jgi:hypothetical protein
MMLIRNSEAALGAEITAQLVLMLSEMKSRNT